MTWVNGKRLASISATSGHSALAFTYDADGLRLTKTAGSVQHKYIWQGGKLVSENYGSTTLEFFYDESGAPYALIYNGTTYYYVTNLQGDVVKIVNASGTSQAEYSYNAWGQVISATGTLAAVNPIRYRGYYYDSESGFYYLKSRYYDPAICRFINADGYASTGQGFIGCNMFAYCNNNPVNVYDPSGNFPWVLPIVIPLLLFLTGCSSQDEKTPEDFIACRDTNEARCYEYAGLYLGIPYNARVNPGDYSARRSGSGIGAYSEDCSLEEIVALTYDDLRTFNLDCTVFYSFNDVPKDSNTTTIACFTYIMPDGTPDYHFAVLLSNGMWADKPGLAYGRWGELTFDGYTWNDGNKITASAQDTAFFCIKSS